MKKFIKNIIGLLPLLIILITFGGCGERVNYDYEGSITDYTPYDREWNRIKREIKSYTENQTQKIIKNYDDLTYIPEKRGKDHWKSPLETIRDRGGDCEDLATVVFFVLRNQNTEYRYRICVGLRSGSSNYYHVWVQEYRNDDIYIIDPTNPHARLEKLSRKKRWNAGYIPKYSYDLNHKYRYNN